jgi:hypothetical protein
VAKNFDLRGHVTKLPNRAVTVTWKHFLCEPRWAGECRVISDKCRQRKIPSGRVSISESRLIPPATAAIQQLRSFRSYARSGATAFLYPNAQKLQRRRPSKNFCLHLSEKSGHTVSTAERHRLLENSRRYGSRKLLRPYR